MSTRHEAQVPRGALDWAQFRMLRLAEASAEYFLHFKAHGLPSEKAGQTMQRDAEASLALIRIVHQVREKEKGHIYFVMDFRTPHIHDGKRC